MGLSRISAKCVSNPRLQFPKPLTSNKLALSLSPPDWRKPFFQCDELDEHGGHITLLSTNPTNQPLIISFTSVNSFSDTILGLEKTGNLFLERLPRLVQNLP